MHKFRNKNRRENFLSLVREKQFFNLNYKEATLFFLPGHMVRDGNETEERPTHGEPEGIPGAG
jgi:hypothetical protein